MGKPNNAFLVQRGNNCTNGELRGWLCSCQTSDQHEMLISLMEGVEDIPEVVLSEGLPWTWETFSDYLYTLDKRRFDVDVTSTSASP